MNINQFLAENKKIKRVGDFVYREQARRVVCADGFHASVQVSDSHYCEPRTNDAAHYSAVEIGFPSESEPLILEYAENAADPTGTVYAYVPVDIVDEVIRKHGGFAN